VPERLGDRVAVGALTSVFPPELVDRVVEQTGRVEKRRRLLPARMVVYYVLALALFAEIGYVEVLRLLVEAPPQARPRAGGPGAVAGQVRAGAGPRPVGSRAAAGAVCGGRPAAGHPGHGGRVVSAVAAGRPGRDHAGRGRHPRQRCGVRSGQSGRGEGSGAFPQVRVVGLVECGTHATIQAVLGPYGTGEVTLAGRLLGGLAEGALAGVLLRADRLFVGAELWRAAAATGADLVWRAKGGKTAPRLPVDQVLADGSWLSRLYAAGDRRKRHPIVVRVIEYAPADPGRPQAAGEVYRLVTAILDPQAAPAAELAALYHERWEVEGALDELKSHQRGAQMVLRSKHPQGVEQEVWAHLLVHYAIRTLMHQAAAARGLDPTGCRLPPRCGSCAATWSARRPFPLTRSPGRSGG
jgi:hypothetical protein